MSHDGVVLDFLGMLVAENQFGRLRVRLGARLGSLGFPRLPFRAQPVDLIPQTIELRLLLAVIAITTGIIGGRIARIRIRRIRIVPIIPGITVIWVSVIAGVRPRAEEVVMVVVKEW